MSLFVLGTDTEVGKTVVAALVCQRYRGLPGIAYWKPVASGSEVNEGNQSEQGSMPGSADRQTVAELVAQPAFGPVSKADSENGLGRAGDDPEMLAEGYSFPDPVSPHLAARRAGGRVDLARLSVLLGSHHAAGRRIVVEGIGGVLVPMNDDGSLFADWVAQSRLPAIVVARTALGTINHTLLTLEALRCRGIPVAGVVMNGSPDAENRHAIEKFGATTVISEVPRVETLDQAELARLAETFDPGGCLRPLLEPTR